VEIQASHLSQSKRQLLQLMRRVGDGRLEAFSIAGGEPQLDPVPAVVFELRIGGPPAKFMQPQSGFALKAPVNDLLDLLTRLGTARVEWLEVRGGLPVRLRVTGVALDATDRR
jgi:hypothetical protein